MDRTYHINCGKGYYLQIESDLTKIKTLSRVLEGIVLVFHKKNPDELDELMGILNEFHNNVREDRAFGRS